MSKRKQKCIVIGAGIAGIATAIRLRLQGFDTEVFEKNNYPGGKLTAFQKDGFHFDAGPSLFTEPELVTQLFQLAGENFEDHFSYKPVDTSCHYFYPDGSSLVASTNKNKFTDSLCGIFGENREMVTSFLENARISYEKIGTLFLDHSLHVPTLFPWNKVAEALKHTKKSYLFGNLHDYHLKYFKDPRTIQLFDRYATYNGSNPFQAPGMLSMIAHLETGKGVYFPRGGMHSITESLYKLACRLDISFNFNQSVEKIVVKNGKVSGIKVDKRTEEADIIVSNMDVYYTYRNLLDDNKIAFKMAAQERSSSAFIFYWGIGKTFHNLGLHNIIFSKNYKEEFLHIFTKKQLFNDPTIYINITSKEQSNLAPAGMENWFVMINTHHHTGENWCEKANIIRKDIIKTINEQLETDISPLIKVEEILHPVMIQENTGSYLGSLYGTSSNNRQAAFLRHPNFSAKTKGLYFAGGSVHPGGGIPLCLRSAAIVEKLIVKNHGNDRT